MSITQFGTIRREVRRIWNRFLRALYDLLQRLYFRKHYDAIVRKNIIRSVGAVPLGKEAAIYLIFPSQGLLTSHIATLKMLRKAEISPIVVSNAPLDAEAHERLHPLTTLVIERPNLGYDFGGYRDGVLELAKDLSSLERLWILNDSVWLLPQAKTWFERARAIQKDFVGATSNYAVLRKSLFGYKTLSANHYRTNKWSHDSGNPRFHYASYALCIGSNILKSSQFLKFWEKLDVRNDKMATVTRGEIGLSQWVISQGFTHAATNEVENLELELSALPDADLDRLAREIVIYRGTKLAELRPHILSTDFASVEGRGERIAFILTAVARQGSACSLAFYNPRRNEFQFLKKSIIWLSSDGADCAVESIAALELELGKSGFIAREAEQIRDARTKGDLSS